MITTCACQHCSAPVEFDPETAGFGATAQCSSCGQRTLVFIQKTETKRGAPAWLGWAVTLGVATLFFVGILTLKGPPLMLLIALSCLVLYFVPSVVGLRKRNAVAIFVLNLFLGWSLVGWVVALVWACTTERES